MPKNLDQVSSFAPEHIHFPAVRITAKRLLDLQSEAIHAAAHVGRPGGQPNGDAGRRQRIIAAAPP